MKDKLLKKLEGWRKLISPEEGGVSIGKRLWIIAKTLLTYINNMSVSTKMNGLMGCFTIAFVFLFVCLVFVNNNNKEAMSERMECIAEQKRLSGFTVVDCNDKPIFKNGYSENVIRRQAIYHIVGDDIRGKGENGTTYNVPNSLIVGKRDAFEQYCKRDRNTGWYFPESKVELTIDIDLQEVAYTMMTDKGYNGSVVVIDYSTGEIKAMVSTPSVDPKNIQVYNDDRFLNKATSTYDPGSVFKVVTVAAVVDKYKDAKYFVFNCDDGKSKDVICYGKEAHGKQELNNLLLFSCNCGIAACGEEYLKDPEELDAMAEKLGLLDEDIIVDMKSTAGQINAAQNFRWTANGQGQTRVSPVAMCNVYAIIANDGVKKPIYIEKATKKREDFPKDEKVMKQETAEFIRSSLEGKMEGAVYEGFGKTGTAENAGKDHSWFICGITEENAPTYAVCTFIRNGGSSKYARDFTLEFLAEIKNS